MPAKTDRLDVRVAPRQKQLIERAAELTGQSVSRFAIRTLVRRARHVVQERNFTRLTARDSKLFVALLTSGVKPNTALMKAAREYNAERSPRKVGH